MKETDRIITVLKIQVPGYTGMIPLSSRIDKYRRIMEKKEKAGKSCDILHIVKLDDGRESAFLIPPRRFLQ